MKNLSLSIIGCGNRGTLYADFAVTAGVKINALCDISPKRLGYLSDAISFEGARFTDPNDFFKEKHSDILAICSMDKDHYEQALKALDLGYHLLLEKPISPSLKECVEIERKAAEKNLHVAVCHVLRYTPFYRQIKESIDSGKIGDVVTINTTENVAYWHQAHSFVRGNWRNLSTSAPMILAKCCHDLDILLWLTKLKAEAVSSFGSLKFFNEENAPKNSADFCFECGVQESCPYNCLKFYKGHYGWFYGARDLPVDEGGLTEIERTKLSESEQVDKVLSNKKNPYSRCVFHCDNDVVDHQVVNVLFENGVTAHLTMTAFSDECNRTIKVHGTYGEIVGDFEKRIITVKRYGEEAEIIDLTKLTDDFSGHGGGDRLLFLDFFDLVKGGGLSKGLTTLSRSVESHKMAFAAEESRLIGGKPVKIT